jgi:hypothetical protein
MAAVIDRTGLEPLKRESVPKKHRYAGEVVYMYAFDVAYEMTRQPVEYLLGQKAEPFTLGASKRSPRHVFFYKPQMVRLPDIERVGPYGPIKLERIVKLLPVGAISITVSVPFAVDRLEDLVVFHDLQLDTGSLADEVRQLAEDIRQEIEAFYVRPVPKLMEEEAYTVFCMEAPLTTSEGLPMTAENWLQAHRRQVASLLTQESDVRHLSRQEAEENTVKYLSYYQNDLVVIDWDAALLVDEEPDFDETLYIMELANLQLAELEAYDRILDDALDRAYRDLSRHPLRTRKQMMRDLKEIRIDLARFSDELSNITKFFGDWHLARIYQNIAERFHLAEWHKTIDDKLKTLDGLYEIIKHDHTTRLMLILEGTIVLLFIIDLVVLFMGLRAN